MLVLTGTCVYKDRKLKENYMTINKNKFFVASGILVMAVLSVSVSWIMAKNFNKDASKLRHTLTVDYKKFKKIDYKYDQIKGKQIFDKTCSTCHGADGVGTRMAPSFRNNQFITGNHKNVLKVVLNGLQGKLVRDGKSFNSTMPAYTFLPHTDLAHVINYIRNSFGNKADQITSVDVITSKVDSVEKKGPWKVEELN
jgi:mono/diheme cytochrome c family protein